MLLVLFSTVFALWATACGLALGLCRAAGTADADDLGHQRRFGLRLVSGR